MTERGKLIVVSGPSGAGKSMTIAGAMIIINVGIDKLAFDIGIRLWYAEE